MQYRSTRGHPELLSFEQAVLRGLAPDGGLYIPTSIPKPNFKKWQSLSFQDLSFQIFRGFIDSKEIPDADLKRIIDTSFGTFSVPEIVPLKKLSQTERGDPLWVLELFHGPTFAFKDVALQFLGNLFDFFLKRQHKRGLKTRLTVVGATSGDTGGAAIYGLKGKENIKLFILHPHGRVSSVQELQMTTVLDENVFNVALEGTFDDCQDIVKQLFADEQFRSKYSLGAINSINWARILAQTSYYFYSFFKLQKQVPNSKIQYVVPTGNFGDILAGFYCKQMGLPIHKLVIATNENDILHRFLETGRYDKQGGVQQTPSPAMDILVSSNFERLLWYLLTQQQQYNTVDQKTAKRSSDAIQSLMQQLKDKGGFSVSEQVLETARKLFGSHRVSNGETSQTIAKYYQDKKYVLDPHTAVGVASAEAFLSKATLDPKLQTVVLATASPGKFPEAVLGAINAPSSNQSKPLTFDDIAPNALRRLDVLPKRVTLVKTGSKENGYPRVKSMIEQTLMLHKL
ncbi:tryptophan synthase beta subunit-like PLP-dependent enzyme [Gorgonomyces haynaldii]|nr:tryptophan synthase beta subunit-like PLP-dependent enzyme [Gorgonomyces haynaldii]